MTEQEAINPKIVLTAWSIDLPYLLRSANAGTNNLSHFVDSASGSYFLRIYQNTMDIERVRYEHALLLQLQHAGLPFAVPQPLANRDGETYSLFVLPDTGNMGIAALFQIIPGRHAEGGNVTHALACGEALAILDRALANITLKSTATAMPLYGDLNHIHSLVQDPLQMLSYLPIAAEAQSRLYAIFRDLAAQIPNLYGQLPQQIIHADFGRTNTLLCEDQVSGILDFEMACRDLRAIDLAVALWSFGIAPWQWKNDWGVIDALIAGYRRHITLTEREITMLPKLLLLREAASLIHRVGRWRQGVASVDEVIERANGMLHVHQWLDSHAARLIRRVEQRNR